MLVISLHKKSFVTSITPQIHSSMLISPLYLSYVKIYWKCCRKISLIFSFIICPEPIGSIKCYYHVPASSLNRTIMTKLAFLSSDSLNFDVRISPHYSKLCLTLTDMSFKHWSLSFLFSSSISFCFDSSIFPLLLRKASLPHSLNNWLHLSKISGISCSFSRF